MVDLRRTLGDRVPVTGGTAPQVARLINATLDGWLQNVGVVTLASGTTETMITAPIFRASTVLILVPRSSAAAAISWWIDDADTRQITIGHDAPGADVEFSWVAIG